MVYLARLTLIIGAAALFAGCDGLKSPVITPSAMLRNGATVPIGAPVAMLQNHSTAKNARSGSWMLPEAKSSDLLYVTNVQTVTVYSYPRGKHVGTLKNFYRPEAECADSRGNVFIGDGDEVVEYAHGGKKPIQTLTMSGDLSQGCAADPTTGNLAVVWFKDIYQGYVAIYQNASGTPTLYTSNSFVPAWCGYDENGNLFVDGLNYNDGDAFEFTELPSGGANLSVVTLNQTIGWPGAIQWDGKYLAIADEDANVVYRFSISGSAGTLQGTVNLGNVQTLLEYWIDGKKIIGADDLLNTVWYWSYPAGGSAIKSVTKAVFHPVGVTISKAPR